ncbi:unnamed protein product [Vitrella brassicaformis CCMP3155]|uniref:Ferrochelatase n=1 Tax=Vitrella brassicaformis (strain CCMP3155) TaxID=1169540 RepID=A0A0G4G103_VITBC|nr:unnamed protein product [Vitrella brassicaformis CCMP3155]|eukprot:CEM21656.1 unnamed protein product [Vitrella brassicaformis CCMP3155]
MTSRRGLLELRGGFIARQKKRQMTDPAASEEDLRANVFHQTADSPIIGVLLVNLGSPDSPTYAALFRYLREFLSDTRVVDLPRILWLPILYLFILPFRSKASALKYQKVWTEKGSPLVATAVSKAEKLQTSLQKRHPESKFQVDVAMRYGGSGPLSIHQALRRLQQGGCRRLLVIPLYPQPAEATTASIFDKLFEEMMLWRYHPDVRIVNGYVEEPVYVKAIAESVRQFWKKHGKGERLLVSYHGIPKDRLTTVGDPYECFCKKTTRLIREELGIKDGQLEMVFQSRFGPAEWLQPYFDDKLAELSKAGVRKVDAICPGFSSDCLETVDEVGREYKELFAHLTGGEGELRYIPALNDSELGMQVLEAVVDRNLRGWI